MKVVVKNGRCAIHRGENRRWQPIALPLENVASAHLRYGHVACVTKSGQCHIYSQKGEHVHTYYFRDTRSAEVVGPDRVAVVRTRGWTEIYSFNGCQLGVHADGLNNRSYY